MLGYIWVFCGLFAVAVPQNVTTFLNQFNQNAEGLYYESSLASWAYNTNITEENAKKMVSTQDCL